MNPYPFIVTLTLDDEAFSFFTQLRTLYFPPERNFLEAHLTLFHQLPPGEPGILEAIKNLCRQQATITLTVTGVINLGAGAAYGIQSNELSVLHQQLQNKWRPWLTAQDSQKLRPHITVQNKVTARQAKETVEKLRAGYWPPMLYGTGLTVWEYRGGPWKLFQTFPFGV